MRSRVHRRVYLDYIGVKRFDADGKLIGEFRIVGLFTSTAYTRIDPHASRICGARSTRVMRAPASIPTAIPARRSPTCWRTIRATSCSRSTRTRSTVRARDPAARRAAARARAGAARPLRPLRLGAGLRAARPLRQPRRASRSATIWPASIKGRVSAFYPFFPEGPLVRVHFIIGRSGGETPRSDRADARAGGRRHRAHLDRRARRGARAGPSSRSRRASCSAATATRSPIGYREAYAPPVAVADIRADREPVAEPPARRRFPSPARGRAARGRPEGLEPRAADPAVRARAGAGEHGLPGRRRAHLPHRADRRGAPRSGCTTCCWSAPTAARSISTRCKARLEAAFLVVMRGARRERRLQRAGARRPALQWRDVALIRTHLALPAPDPRALFAGLHVGDAAQARRHRRRRSSQLFHARFDPRAGAAQSATRKQKRDRRAHRRGAAERSKASTRTASCATSSTRCSRRCAPISTRLDEDGQPQGADRDQVRQPQDRRHAAAAAALRDLRLFAARRRRASALRQGRARRHPLVRPAAGFPHRGARPGQGAAGQERRDRAGRRQGRLRAEAAAEGARRARRCRPKASPPTSCSSRRCSTSPTISRPTARSCRPTTWCATTATIPIWWSPPTRARRPSPTSPTRFRSSTTSGSATPSPPAARPATTTRRWASPRAAPGKR